MSRGETLVRRLSIAATVGMFLVLVMGATVTNTGSSEGCGRHWPLCHGEFIPSYAFKTMIEFSHRFITGVVGFLLLGTAIGAWKLRGDRRATKVLIGLMLGSVVLQSGMGAWAVMYPQTAAVLAIHFGISLVCFAATFLLMRLLYEPADGPRQDGSLVPNRYRWLAWATIAGSIGVAYLGAYMRHSGKELACYRWPACTNDAVASFSDASGISFAHRLAATTLGLLVVLLAVWSYRLRDVDPTLFPTARGAVFLVGVQALIGGYVVHSRLVLASTLMHAGAMALIFVCLADLCWRTLPRRAQASTARYLSPATPAPAD
jgi:cytochrome c oxidase assembly protein subunit 15